MNLDEKIARSISAKMEEVVDLFQDTGFDASEILSYLRSLVDQIPLLQDIKMEVKQLQNSLNDPETEKKKKDPLEEDPNMDLSPSDPEIPEMRRRLIESVKGIDKERQVLRQLLPSPDDPIPDWMKDIPWYDIISDSYKLYKLIEIMKDDASNIKQEIQKAWNKEQTWSEALHNMTKDDLQKLEEVIRVLNSDLEDEILKKMSELFHLGEDVSDKLDDSTSNIQTDIQSSKSYISDKIDKTGSDIADDILDAKTDILSNLGQSVADLQSDINSAETQLSHKIDDVSGDIESHSSSLSDQIHSMESNLNDSIHSVDSNVTQSTSDIRSDLSNLRRQNITCCENQTTGFQNTLDSLGQVDGKLDNIDSKMDTLKSPQFYLLNSPSYIQNSQQILRGLL